MDNRKDGLNKSLNPQNENKDFKQNEEQKARPDKQNNQGLNQYTAEHPDNQKENKAAADEQKAKQPNQHTAGRHDDRGRKE